MEKKKWVKFAGFAMLVLLSLFLCVGCADNSVEDSDEVAYIDFGRESASSRGIESWNEDLYPPENLYWTYTAKKIRGNYTTGQTALGEKRPVIKNGPAKGLGAVGPFSVGVWEFNLYGYTKCTVNSTTGELVFADEDLVYTGKTGTEEHNYTTIDKRTSGDSMQQIVFELTPTSFWNSLEGQLAIRNMHLTVPENQRFTIDSAITSPVKTFVKTTVSIVSVPTDAKAGGTTITVPFVLAESLTEITEEKVSGADVALEGFGAFNTTGASNEFTPGRYELEFKAEYKDVFTTDTTDAPQYAPDGWAQIGEISTYPIEIKAGVKTTLSGDINDIQVAEDANAKNTENSYIVTKILKTGKDGTDVDDWSYFNSLKDAVTAYGTSGYMDNTVSPAVPNPIVQLRDIVEGETVTPGSNGAVVVQDTDKSFIVNDLTLSGYNPITFSYGTSTDVKDYKFSGNGFKVVNLYRNIADSDVWLKTDGTGTVEVNAESDRVFHTGKAGTVNIVAVGNATAGDTAYSKGYHLGTDKDGSATVTNVGAVNLTKGRLEMNGNTCVQTLTIDGSATSATVSVSGKKSTVVNNCKYGMTVSLKTSGNLVAFTSTSATYKGLFAELCLDDAKDSPTSTYYYLISGIEEALPANPYTFGAMKFLEWNAKKVAFEEDVATSYKDKERVALTKPETAYTNPILKLYAQWSGKPVGGTIYYCDLGNVQCNLADYKFYKADGTAITVTGTTGAAVVSQLADAKYYTSQKGNSHPDLFYVLGDTSYFVASLKFAPDNTAVLGSGFDIYGNVGDGKTVYKIAVESSYAAVSTDNIWSYVRYLNDVNGAAADTSYVSKTQKPGNCVDWYIPTMNDLIQLGLWCDFLKYDASLTSYDTGDSGSSYYGKYTAKYASTATVPDTLSDVQKAVWNSFKTKSSYSCNEGIVSDSNLCCGGWFYDGRRFGLDRPKISANADRVAFIIRSF